MAENATTKLRSYFFPTSYDIQEFDRVAKEFGYIFVGLLEQRPLSGDAAGVACYGKAGLDKDPYYQDFILALQDTDKTLISLEAKGEQTGYEVIVTDAKTGGKKGKKPLEVGAIDPRARAELGKVAAFGTQKYDRGNYLKGYDWSLSVDALHRHMLAFESGEDLDPESGLLHTAHAAWHALALCSFQLGKLGTDDRHKMS